VAIRVAPQIRHDFPLTDALHLAEVLGYDPHAMGELLPSLAKGITTALTNYKT
jgi:hypothetical protein